MPMPARKLEMLEELPGWLTFGEAAAEMGVSTERVRQLATNKVLKTARRIGQRPIGIIRASEVREWKRTKAERTAAEAAARAEKEAAAHDDTSDTGERADAP